MKTYKRQRGQGMVEYTIVTSLGILVLLGPGADVINWTMAAIKDNYQGYSYAMSLSQWPEFDIRSAEPVEVASGWDPTANSSMSDTGTRGGGNVPVFTPPDTAPEDFLVLDYRRWLVEQGVDQDRATLLSGLDESQVSQIEEAASFVSDFFEAAGEIFDSDLGPDVIEDAIDNVLPPDFGDLLGGFPPSL